MPLVILGYLGQACPATCDGQGCCTDAGQVLHSVLASPPNVGLRIVPQHEWKEQTITLHASDMLSGFQGSRGSKGSYHSIMYSSWEVVA